MSRTEAWRKGLRSLIVCCLKEHGPLTTRAISKMTGVNQGAIAPRMTELFAERRAVETGETVSSESGKGRRLKVWEAIEA